MATLNNMNPRYIICAYCERTRRVTRDGKVFKHGKCPGSGRPQAGFKLAPGEPARMEILESEAQLKCATCANDHPMGKLCKPCNEHGCECWCNRSTTPPLPEHRQRRAEPVGMTTEQATKILTDAMMEALAKSIAAAAARGELTAESLASIAKAAGNNAAQTLMCDDE